MAAFAEIDVVLLDVLGTLVDEPGGIEAALRAASGEREVGPLRARWQELVGGEQQRIAEGHRAYANGDVLDDEAATAVAAAAGITDRALVRRLATAAERLPAWPDSAAGIDRLTPRVRVLGLSNASARTLGRLGANAGLRWHGVLSAETVRAYKPDPAVYRLAVEASGCRPDRILMVAAHAWDLRAAQAAGMRTAYVHRPVGDPPRDTDTFDVRAEGLLELAERLAAR
ncbi:haloacid dehalogenase type II [Agromyces soli]|uniref:Haloacid dehalogenase type II n=1 Tax=Agromyces soli TaxID=659012 RepID=A0ABY4AYF6_9MICO|nr:haloacid dehalogenase type II [Agromyces soli]UOE27869.1 haloacid dehalogenase type II [Agromyces soli]